MCDGFSEAWLFATMFAGTAIQSDDSARRQQHANERREEIAREEMRLQDEHNLRMEELQQEATHQSAEIAEFEYQQQQRENNRINAKHPDVSGLSSGNKLEAKGGQSGTLLTGPKGVNKSDLTLGKKTLLGK